MLLDKAFVVIASFTSPMQIDTNPQSMLWMLPLATAITIVYKATKVPKITAGDFIKKTASTLMSGIFLIVIIAIALHIVAWIVTE